MSVKILMGDVRERLREIPDGTVNCVVTSPPYWGLRDYGVEGQIGTEATPDEYVDELVRIFENVRRVLREDGTLWLNLGDSYFSGGRKSRDYDEKNKARMMGYRPPDPEGLKPKDLVGIPWMVAFALRKAGWYLRQDIIWAKPNPMPESVTDRCTKSHEYIFLLSKSERYYYDQEAIKEPSSLGDSGSVATDQKPSLNIAHKENKEKSPKKRGHVRLHEGFAMRWDKMTRDEQCSGTRNKRSVWTVATKPFSEAHFATYPVELIRPCILAGCPEGGTVLDPFGGAGTTALAAEGLGRNSLLVELNPEYVGIIERRLRKKFGMMLDFRVDSLVFKKDKTG